MKINYVFNLALAPLMCASLVGNAPLMFSNQFSLMDSSSKDKAPEMYNFDTLLNTTPLQNSMNSMRYYLNELRVGTRDITDNALIEKKETVDETFTRGFSRYVENVYNRQNYAALLSQDGTHLTDFLQLSDDLGLNPTTLYVGMRLFHNKIKSCEIIDDTVILQVLEPMGKHLERLFVEEESSYNTNLSFIRKHTENLMLSKFTDHYESFQQSPDVFLSRLSDEITKEFKNELTSIEKNIREQQEKIEIRERLRSIVIRFVETALGKIMWNTQSHESIWFSFQAIAHDIQGLGSRSVLNHMDELDSLLWSLTHRFCYFVDLVGSHLPLAFYDEVETDLSNRSIYFLEEKEQDACIKTKKEILEETIIKGKMKALAYHRGIVDHIS